MEKAAKPRTLKDSMHKLPLTYNSSISWFTVNINEDWFYKNYRNCLHNHPDDVKALLILDNATVHPHTDRPFSNDGKIRAIFLSSNTSLIFSIVAWKR